jgi:pheromone a factor receptor
MAPLPMKTRASAAANAQPTAPQAPYPAAIVLASCALLMCLLLISPMCWHYRNRNIGAMLLVAWVIIMNVQNVVNPILWSNDDMIHWYKGAVLCDIEINIQTAAAVALPAALTCVLRGLANAMDTNQISLGRKKAQRWRNYAIDILLCIGFPALQMLFHWLVQSTRYSIIGIFGCQVTADRNWLAVTVMSVVPLIWTLVDSYFAGQ